MAVQVVDKIGRYSVISHRLYMTTHDCMAIFDQLFTSMFIACVGKTDN